MTQEELTETNGNREEWLRDLVDVLRVRYDGELPENVHNGDNVNGGLVDSFDDLADKLREGV